MTGAWRQPDAAETVDLSNPQTGAAHWDARLRSPACTDEERSEFARWRESSSANAAAFEQLQLILEEVRDARHHPKLRAMRDVALADAHGSRWKWVARAAALATVAIGAGLVAYWYQGGDVSALLSEGRFSPQSLATAIGAQSTVSLDDGSTLILNTQSRATIDYDRLERRVNLLAGQAWFEVAKDPDRPFVVYAGDQRITALGTAFDVRLDAKEVRVTLVEGHVAVDSGSGIGSASTDSPSSSQQLRSQVRTELAPGEQLVVAAGTLAPQVQKANVKHVTSWREGYVEFEDVPLSEFVTEMNRYSAIQVVLADEEMGRLRLGGRFRTGQVSTFVDALVESHPVQERHVEEDQIRLEWRR